MPHTFDPANADKLDDVGRYRFCSRDELVAMLDPAPDHTVADLGSGTGFYTTDVAPFVGRLCAVDVQPEMHEKYEEQGLPGNVELVTSEVADLPFDDATLDAAFSTMTFPRVRRHRCGLRTRRSDRGRRPVCDRRLVGTRRRRGWPTH